MIASSDDSTIATSRARESSAEGSPPRSWQMTAADSVIERASEALSFGSFTDPGLGERGVSERSSCTTLPPVSRHATARAT